MKFLYKIFTIKWSRERKTLFFSAGFTLIELLVVISIIGLLSSVVLTSLSGARKKARHARRVSDLKQLQLALSLYYENQTPNIYPSTGGQWWGVHSCWPNPGGAKADWIPGLVTGGYIPVLPRDPSDNGSAIGCGGVTYIYRSVNGSEYKLLDHGVEDCEGLASYSGMKDPTRDRQVGGDPALVDGNECWAVGVWTPGAVSY